MITVIKPTVKLMTDEIRKVLFEPPDPVVPCAWCERQADHVTVIRREMFLETEVTVWCHGCVEVYHFSDKEMEVTCWNPILDLVAFAGTEWMK